MSATTSTGHRAPTRDEMLAVTHWRELALTRMPYMAPILYGLRVVAAPGLGTFAVDEHMRLYVDFEAAEQYGEQWCWEGLLHECGHVFGQHHERARDKGVPERDARARRDFNIAGDCAINDDLIQVGLALTPQDPMPSHLGEPDHQTVEHYYDVIRAKRNASGKQSCPECGQSNQGQEDFPGQGQPGQCPACGQEPGQFSGCGSVSGGQPAPGELGDDDMDGQAPAMTPVEQELVQIATAQAVLDEHAKGRGNTPASMVTQAQAALAPSKTPWRALLGPLMRRCLKASPGRGKRTHKRVNRRRHHVRLRGRQVVYPGTFTPKPTIAVVRDTSGSMSPADLSVTTREVEAIAGRMGVRGNDLRVLDVDADVQTITAYAGVSSVETVTGRGGTNMVAGIEAALGLRPRPDVVVVLTDMGTPWPSERPGVPVIACAVGADEHSLSAVPDWLSVVVVDND